MKMWHKELGFSSYPLDPRSNPNLVGVDQVEDKLITYILQGNICALSGPTGSGKTSMLKKIRVSQQLKDFNFVYITADGVKSNFDIMDAVNTQKSFWQRLTLAKPKNLVILLDECQLATRILTESIKSKWNFEYPNGQRFIHSVVVSQIDDRLGTNFSGSFADRLGKRLLVMPKLKGDELESVLRVRLDNGKKNYIESFTPEALKFLTKSADGSVRQILEYADAVFRLHDNFDKNPLLEEGYRISHEIVFNALQQSGIVVDERAQKEIKKTLKLIRESKRLQSVIEMYEQFGSLSPIELAEKLDITKQNAISLIRQLEKSDALIVSHEDADTKHYVLAPRLAHELVKA